MIAILFVADNSVYKTLPDVDCYDRDRNACNYDGPYSVVAHPPCQLWGAMAAVNYARWGGEHNRPGNDGGLFKFALLAVQQFNGVLEHPAKTKAWSVYGLTQPQSLGWQKCASGGWVCEVWQSAYGHKANKATWLYYHGKSRPAELRWDRPRGSHQVGFHDQRGKASNKPTLSKKEANATPLEFALELINLAKGAK